MNAVYCKKDTTLTGEEKEVFSSHLARHELTDNIWDVFNEWVVRSTPPVTFFYIKVYQDNDLIGLGLLLRVKPFDLRASYARLRNNPVLNKLAVIISKLSSNCVYISFRNLITSNITRPFFYRHPEMENIIMAAILTYLKEEKEADMITFVDTSGNDSYYADAGYKKYPSSSEAWFDVTRYQDISEYLNEHKNLKKNLKRKKDVITTEVTQGPLTDIDIRQIKDCLNYSIEESRVNTPSQKFFEDNIFETEVYNSDKYLHIFIRVNSIIAGFHTYQVSGANMGGVLGGFNREYARKNYVYERVIVASLEYAIQNDIKRLYYSLVDNYTKLRLVDCLEPCGLYFYAGNALNRKVFDLTFKFNDVHDLYLLEKRTSP